MGMTFKEAVDKAREMFPAGTSKHISYEHWIFSPGREETRCRVYVDPPQKGGYGDTWEEAFLDLQQKLGIREKVVNEDAAPKEPPGKESE
jgi:hypothetical protein